MHLYHQLSLELKASVEVKPILFSVGKQIAAGMRRLDLLAGPDWRSRIKKRIDIGSIHDCVTGQVFGDYEIGCCELGLNPCSNEPAMYGFNVLDIDSLTADREIEALNRGWHLALKSSNVRSVKRLKIVA